MRNKAFNNLSRAASFLLIAVPLVFASCGGGETDTVEGKKKALAEKRKALNELKKEVEQLENELAEASGEKEKKVLKKVVVEPLNASTFKHYIEVQGKVQTDKNVTVTSEVSGLVTQKFVSEGDRVSKGQNLLQLDASIIRKNIQELETRLDLAKVVFQKQENLYKQKIGSEIQYLQAKNNKEALESQLQTLNTQLSKAYVKAPLTGIVDEFFINQGEMAMPGAPVARVVNLNRVEVAAEVSEVYVPYVNKGDSVTVNFEAIGITKRVPIRLIGQFINPENRTFRIEAVVDNKEGYLKPNTMATVKINDFTKEQAITIPSFVLQRSTSGNSFVYTVSEENGATTVQKQMVKSGKSYDGQTLITEGLKAGDRIVVKGYSEVVAGEAVDVVKGNKSTAAL